MAKFTALTHIVHRGEVVKPGGELDLTKAQSDRLLEKKFVAPIKKADEKKVEDKKDEGSGE